jgi:excisionase family DNA binding protein
MSQMSTGLTRQEKRAQPSPSVAPLAVPPLEAARLLSLGMTKIYRLMRAGELISYRDGRARRITMASIHEHMARRLADDNAPSSRQRRSRRGLWQSGKEDA